MPTTKKKDDDKPASKEITLRFDGPLVTPQEFRKAVEAFVELLIQVSEDVTQGEGKLLWNMSVRKGSNVLVACPVPDVRTYECARVTIRTVKTGIRLLESGKVAAPHFNRRALQAVRDLATLKAKPGRQGITVLEIGTGKGKPIILTEKTATFCPRISASNIKHTARLKADCRQLQREEVFNLLFMIPCLTGELTALCPRRSSWRHTQPSANASTYLAWCNMTGKAIR